VRERLHVVAGGIEIATGKKLRFLVQ
jgi:hypothetical protein